MAHRPGKTNEIHKSALDIGDLLVRGDPQRMFIDSEYRKSRQRRRFLVVIVLFEFQCFELQYVVDFERRNAMPTKLFDAYGLPK